MEGLLLLLLLDVETVFHSKDTWNKFVCLIGNGDCKKRGYSATEFIGCSRNKGRRRIRVVCTARRDQKKIGRIPDDGPPDD